MKKFLWIFLIAFTACSMPVDTAKSEQAVATFHELLDAGQFQSIYDQSADDLKKIAKQQEFITLLDAIHRKLGTTKSTHLEGKGVNYSTSGTLVTLRYSTTYAEGESTEEFVFMLQDDKAILAGYHINSNALLVK